MNKRSMRRTLFSIEGESKTSKDWPPIWSVSFSDITTLLMTAFLLWYSLTALKIPFELLTVKDFERITPKDIEFLKELRPPLVLPKRFIEDMKELTPLQREAIELAKKTKKLGEEIKDYIDKAGLGDEVSISFGFDHIVITTRTPLLFDEGEAKLKESSLFLLDKIVDLIKGLTLQIRIEGHTDKRPIHFYHRHIYPSNWELSSSRAVNVANYFIKKGIPTENIGVSGYAWMKNIAPNDTEEDRAKNRRVEIYIFLTPKDEKG